MAANATAQVSQACPTQTWVKCNSSDTIEVSYVGPCKKINCPRLVKRHVIHVGFN